MSVSKIAVLITFVALNVFDVLTTNHVLARGGWEANPLMALNQAALGSMWWAPKLALMIACALAMLRWPMRYILPAVGLMAVVVMNNAVQV